MSKNVKKVEEAMEKGVNAVFNTFVDRMVDRVDQIEPTVEKGKETVEKITEIAAGGVGAVIDAVADHVSGIVNKEVSLETEKERAKNTVETLMGKTGEYIEVMAEAVSGGITQVEGTWKRDVEAAKELTDELKENVQNLKK